MNIGYVYGFNSYPPAGGGGVHVYNLARNLVSMGHQVHCFEPEQNPDSVIYPATAEGLRRFSAEVDLVYVRIDGSFLGKSDLKLECMASAASKPLVWEVNSPTDETLARLRYGARSYRRPANRIAAALKDFARDVLFRHSVAREGRLRRRLARNVDAAICVSDELRQYAQQDLGIEHSSVIPNGSDPEIFSGADPGDLLHGYDDHFKVVYAGASKWFWQGVDLVYELASMAERRGDKILFALLDNSAVSSGKRLPGNVIAFNRVGYFDVPKYLAAADACLCLYHDFSWCRYGFYLSPLKLYDYMAAGKPVIASRVGQIRQVIEHGRDGLLVGDRPEEIYDSILYCRDNPVAKDLGRNAQAKVARLYNWRRAAESTVEVFEAVASRS